MNETEIRKACANLIDAAGRKDNETIARISVELVTQVLVDLNNISYQLTEISQAYQKANRGEY